MPRIQAHVAIEVEPSASTVQRAAELYRQTFGAPPYHEPPERAEEFAARVVGYARDREGSRLAWIDDPADGSLLAMALGVIGTPGTWWRDQVAAFLTDPVVRQEVLGNRCLEVVHVATRADRRRQGLGTVLLDLLTAGTPAPTAVLSCKASSPASRLYLATGWELIADDFGLGPDASDDWLMYKRLGRTG